MLNYLICRAYMMEIPSKSKVALLRYYFAMDICTKHVINHVFNGRPMGIFMREFDHIRINPRLTKVVVNTPPPEIFSMSPKNPKESDQSDLGNINYILGGHFDE